MRLLRELEGEEDNLNGPKNLNHISSGYSTFLKAVIRITGSIRRVFTVDRDCGSTVRGRVLFWNILQKH